MKAISLTFWIGLICWLQSASAKSEVYHPREVMGRALERLGHLETRGVLKALVKARVEKDLAWDPLTLQLGTGGFSTGPDRGPYQEILVSQMLPFSPSRYHLKESIGLRANLAERQADALVKGDSNSVLEQISNFFLARRRRDHILERQKRVELLERFLRNRLSATPTAKLDRALLASRLREIQVENLEARLEFAQVSAVLGLAADLPERFDIDESPLDFSRWESEVLAQAASPKSVQEVRSLEDSLFFHGLSSAKSFWVPSFGLYFYQNEQRPDVFEKTQVLGIMLQIPLSGRSANLRTQELEVKMAAQERRKEDLNIRTLEIQLKSASEALSSFRKIYSENGLQRMEKDLDQATKSFELGQVAASAMLDLEDQTHIAHRRELELERARVRSLIELARALKYELGWGAP